MTTQPDKVTPLEAHIEKTLKEAVKQGVVVEYVPYKDRMRVHVKVTPSKKK